MNIKYIKENYYFETLNETHDLSNFNSSSSDLNDFLKNDALKLQEGKLSLTKLIICDDEIIGYVSLLTDIIPLKDIRDDITKKRLKKNYLLITQKNCLQLK